MCQLLLRAGAERTATDGGGRSPAQLAALREGDDGRRALVGLLCDVRHSATLRYAPSQFCRIQKCAPCRNPQPPSPPSPPGMKGAAFWWSCYDHIGHCHVVNDWCWPDTSY